MTFEYKLIAAGVIALVALAGGRLALRISADARGAWYLTLGNALAGGIFLGAALIHLFGDAQEHMAAVVDSEVRWVAILAGLGFLLVMLPERVVFAGQPHGDAGSAAAAPPVTQFLLAIVLSIHSLIAGAALGLETDASAFVGVLIAILAHKGSAAFALAAVLRRAGMDRGRIWTTLLIFSATTPAGIVLGALYGSAAEGQAAHLAEAIFDALAAGTFLYVASLEIIDDVFGREARNWLKFAVLGLGFALMALLSLWT